MPQLAPATYPQKFYGGLHMPQFREREDVDPFFFDPEAEKEAHYRESIWDDPDFLYDQNKEQALLGLYQDEQ
jgi:hypothetical protein